MKKPSTRPSEDEKAHEQKRGLPGNARIGLAEIKEAAKVAPALFKIALDGAGKVSVDNLEIHPLALAFPAYGEEDLAKLAGDIRDHGMFWRSSYSKAGFLMAATA